MDQRAFIAGWVPAYYVVYPTRAYDRAITWREYRGAYFSIEYPAGFQVRGIDWQPDSMCAGYLGAFFSSPDRTVEFYATLLPGTEPPGIALDPRKESFVAQHEQRDQDGRVTRWYTIQAKDGSYARSYEDTRYLMGQRFVVGIKYRDMQSYYRYRDQYLHFKNSWSSHCIE